MNQTTPLSNVYVILNKVLNTLIRRKFGEQYSVRLNSLCFIANRTDVCRFQYFTEKIGLKTKKPVTFYELNLIKEFLLFYINSLLICIDSKNYVEVTNIEGVII
ncbi:hypothetical protein [Flavobacterium sp.]|uniref:hypothetical protein n=1 Tax=Flavobacterium sp. TaxID=239 RepID=UPI00333E6AC1